MNFQVPQFIEQESKIIGPLTFRQFIFVGGAGGAVLLLYFALPFGMFILLVLPILALGLALAFMRSGGRSLPELVVDFLNFGLGTKAYTWKKTKLSVMAESKGIPHEALPKTKDGGIEVPLKKGSKIQGLVKSL